ncbi:MAG: hypothetical protein ABI045_00135 [Flavobacteriales bacterium]
MVRDLARRGKPFESVSHGVRDQDLAGTGAHTSIVGGVSEGVGRNF